MSWNFPLILTLAVLISGFIGLLDILLFEKNRRPGQKANWLVDNARSLFPVLLIVWIIRSFIVQPFRVPTGSLEPTVMPGDFLLVNQFSYGLRLPVLNTKIIPISEPKRGDIAVFRWPVNTHIDFVKRVIGLPGDHIVYQNKVLYINGVQVPQHYVGTSVDEEPGLNIPVVQYQENLGGVKYTINVNPAGGETQNFDLLVPAGEYFMMGDNRDDSADSRSWGFVPEQNLIGKAFLIWMSWDSQTHRPRFSRVGKVI